MNRNLPVGATAARRTPIFSVDSVPPALLNSHKTTVWAELVVIAGVVVFSDERPDPWTTTVDAGDRVVILPERLHRIEPSADARFYVQFYDS